MKVKSNNSSKTEKNTIKVSIDNLEILSDHIIVSAVTVEQAKGLVKPDQYEDKQEFGKIVKVGSAVQKSVKVGDIVLFGKWSTISITLSGKDYLMMREEDLIGVIRK